MPKKKTKKRSPSSFKKLNDGKYEVVWNVNRTECQVICTNKGVCAFSCMGVTDTPIAFENGEEVHLLSINYIEGYACLEIFDDEEEPAAVVFAEPKDIQKLFKKELEKIPPDKLAKRLAKEA